MKVESAKMLAKYAKEIRDRIAKPTISAGKIEDIQKRYNELSSAAEDHPDTMTTMTVGNTVVDVPIKVARDTVGAALEQEKALVDLYKWRMEQALLYLDGQYDGDFFNE